jgi:hypothetical protein
MSSLNKKADGPIEYLSTLVRSSLTRQIVNAARDFYKIEINPINLEILANAEFESGRYQVDVVADFVKIGDSPASAEMPWLNQRPQLENLVRIILSIVRQDVSTWLEAKAAEMKKPVPKSIWVKVTIRADGNNVFENPYVEIVLR